MNDQPKALIFPYASIEPGLARRLSRLFKPVVIFLAAGMAPPPELARLAEEGGLTFFSPGQAEIDQPSLKAALAELRGWAEGIRDIRELAPLWVKALSGETEESASALASAIRGYGRLEPERPIWAHLLIHLAAYHDQRRAEVKRLVADLKSYENDFSRSVGLKLEGEEPSPFQPALPEPAEDPLLELRLKAWACLFKQGPVLADLWLTSAAVIAHLSERLAAADRPEPRLVGEVSLEESATDFIAWLARLRAVQEAAEGQVSLGQGIRLWRLPGQGLAELFDLAALEAKKANIIGEVVGWPDG